MTLHEAISNLDNLLIACDSSGKQAWNIIRKKLLKVKKPSHNKQSEPCELCGSPTNMTPVCTNPRCLAERS
jgi:hypothetical protein